MGLLSIGTSALLTSQNALATTSHNISNVNTEGYSRQRTEVGTQTPDFFGGFYVGTGVTVSGIDRMYDQFLGNQVRNYTSSASHQDTFLSFSREVDRLLGSETLGLNEGIESFFNAVYEVSNDPTSVSARQLMLSEAELLSERFNTLSLQLNEFDDQIDNVLSATVDEVNTLTNGIASLNQAIASASSAGTGASPNDLLDQRDQLINELSELVSVETTMEDNGSVNVFVGTGQALVVGFSQVNLTEIADNSTTPPRVSIAYGTTTNDISAQLTGGKIGGAFQVRSQVIDSAISDLDTLAGGIVTSFNTVQTAGVDLDGVAGTNLFDPTGTTAGTMNVLITDPRAIAASSAGATAGVGNNENALAMANLQTDLTMAGGTQTFSETYNRLVSDIATKTLQADVGQQTQEGLLNQVQLRYESVSGVNLDEEAANLIKFQQSYQAASQIITASNTIFNALINAV
jgi:flagellar hook-associated protein 1 FlgK